ncbi:MAG: MFS transporter [Firmicutes bacterium]|nr:MFS transporter [Bacillota bacterium]MBQ6259632.1 MFS transporter [Bacillota bacterium]MBR0114162.1 MFS transporter [Bacillota bacterium]
MNDKKEMSLWEMILDIPNFWKNQASDWKITVLRTSLERLGYQIILPYLSIYIIALGATKTQLGTITSLGMLMSGLLAPFAGGFIDRNGPKKIYSFGIMMLFLSYMIYAFAADWHFCIIAMVMYYFGQGLANQSCATICGNCLKSCDRARGMMICESLGAGILGMIGPMIAAFVLTRILGVSEHDAGASDYRWLFFIAGAFTLMSLMVVIFKLTNTRFVSSKPMGSNALAICRDIIRNNPNARKWLVIASIHNLSVAMVIPYFQVFAKEVKGGGVTVLATMVTLSAVMSTVLGFPAGAMADKVGRKKVLYVTSALYWCSMIILMTARSDFMLILAGGLLGFYYITSPIAGAVQRELVDNSVMGVWIGLTKFTNAITSAIMASIAGLIYDRVGPMWVFVIYICLDAFVRVPLLRTMPETLDKKNA